MGGAVFAAGCLHYKNKCLLWYQNRWQSLALCFHEAPVTPRHSRSLAQSVGKPTAMPCGKVNLWSYTFYIYMFELMHILRVNKQRGKGFSVFASDQTYRNRPTALSKLQQFCIVGASLPSFTVCIVYWESGTNMLLHFHNILVWAERNDPNWKTQFVIVRRRG